MGSKKSSIYHLNWQTTTPVPFNVNTPPTGTLLGVMASTNTIYTNIQNVLNVDNHLLELTYTGTATGTISVFGSVSGINFYALTFDPLLSQPAGSSGGYLIDLTQYAGPFLYIGYTNASGSGTLDAWICSKDIN